MFDFLELLYRARIFLLFVFLEILAITITSSAAKDKLIDGTSSSFSSFIVNAIDGVFSYFNLTEVNQKIVDENTQLKQVIQAMKVSQEELNVDTTSQSLLYRNAKVIRNSILKHNNYITINRGFKQGVRSKMAVVNRAGVVGIVVKTSANYAVVMSLLNSKSKVSAKLKGQREFGSVVWDSYDFEELLLKNIPSHIKVNQGDTVVTNSYSSIFPAGEMLGTVLSVEKNQGDNFLSIRLKSAVDFTRLEYVYVVENLTAKERLKLEEDAAKN